MRITDLIEIKFGILYELIKLVLENDLKMFINEEDLLFLSRTFKKLEEKKSLKEYYIEYLTDIFIKLYKDLDIIFGEIFMELIRPEHMLNYRAILKNLIMTACYGARVSTNTRFLKEELEQIGLFYSFRLLNKITTAFRKIIKQDLKKSFAIYNLFLEVTNFCASKNKSVVWKNPFGMKFFLKIYKKSKLLRRIGKRKSKKKTLSLAVIPKTLEKIKLNVVKMCDSITASIIHSFDASIMYFFYEEFQNEIEQIFGSYLNEKNKIISPVDSVHDSFATLPVFYYHMKSALRRSYEKVIKFSKEFIYDFIEMNLKNLPLTKDEKDQIYEKLLKDIKLGKFDLKYFSTSNLFVDF
jgi:hypothetical protein